MHLLETQQKLVCVCVCEVPHLKCLGPKRKRQNRPIKHIKSRNNINYNINATKTGCIPSKNNTTIRYDTRCYFNVRSKADISQLNLPRRYDSAVLPVALCPSIRPSVTCWCFIETLNGSNSGISRNIGTSVFAPHFISHLKISPRSQSAQLACCQ